MTDTITKHKAVTITYLIRDESGQTVEQNDVPVTYVHGVGSELLEVLETALEGHKVGDKVEVEVSPENGFGHHDPEMTFTDDITNVPPEYHHVGAEAEFQNENGEQKIFIVSKVDDKKITLDGNHPLAGKSVVFVVSVNDIRDASADEIANKVPENAVGLESVEPAPAERH